jgi:hypothetical protein
MNNYRLKHFGQDFLKQPFGPSPTNLWYASTEKSDESPRCNSQAGLERHEAGADFRLQYVKDELKKAGSRKIYSFFQN